MSLFIEGTAFPLGILNTNGWGVPFAEADNAIKSLKTSVVRICSRVDPHVCDIMGDPKSEIGHAVDAGLDGDNVSCKAEITDSIAVQKIEDGTWKPFWSIFASIQEIDSGGWAHGVVIESITIVNNPAWETAKWSVVSASSDGTKRFHITSPFKVIASGDKNMPDETIEDLKKQIEEKDKLIEELKPKVENVPALETQVVELTASNQKLTKELADKTKLAASLELEKAESIPMKELDERIAAAIADHDKEVEARNTLAAARARFVAARKAHIGIDTKPEEFTTLSAADFEKLAADHEDKVGASGSDPIQYNVSGSGGHKSPIFDPFSKSFSQGA
jgi:hypothetical protein